MIQHEKWTALTASAGRWVILLFWPSRPYFTHREDLVLLLVVIVLKHLSAIMTSSFNNKWLGTVHVCVCIKIQNDHGAFHDTPSILTEGVVLFSAPGRYRQVRTKTTHTHIWSAAHIHELPQMIWVPNVVNDHPQSHGRWNTSSTGIILRCLPMCKWAGWQRCTDQAGSCRFQYRWPDESGGRKQAVSRTWCIVVLMAAVFQSLGGACVTVCVHASTHDF